MEFHEKLQELRKERGLTQEELAEALFVSRTAISKWESGRGYPNIDSLKEISKYFSVSIDDLLSSEKILSIAETENKSNIREVCDFLIGLIDVCVVLLIILPLYPMKVGDYVYSVNLFEYTKEASWISWLYWGLFLVLIFCGVVNILFTQFKKEKEQRIVRVSSFILNTIAVIVLAMTREAYAVTILFLFFLIKGCILFKESMVK